MAKASRGGRAGPANGEMAAGSKAAGDAGSTIATGLQDLAQAWDYYARHVMERTAEATQALLKCRTFNDMLGVQAELMRGHLQAFLDQSTKLAEISNRMAARSLEEIRHDGGETGTDKNR